MISHGPPPRWLFRAGVPVQPLDLHSLITQLNRHGISARPARNGALAALASDLPAAVLADFLGIHGHPCLTTRPWPLPSGPAPTASTRRKPPPRSWTRPGSPSPTPFPAGLAAA